MTVTDGAPARMQKPHFLERASVVMVDEGSGLTRAPKDNLQKDSLEFKENANSSK